MHEGERMDEWMDAALRSYAEPEGTTEPRLAFARLMEVARQQQLRRRKLLWLWAVAFPALVCLALVSMRADWDLHNPRVPEIAWIPQPPVVVRPGLAGAGEKAARPDRIHSLRRAAVAQQEHLPKLDVFPTPQPLSQEERALLRFAHNSTTNVQRDVIESQQHWDRPLVIAEVKIRPLSGDENQEVNQKSNPER